MDPGRVLALACDLSLSSLKAQLPPPCHDPSASSPQRADPAVSASHHGRGSRESEAAGGTIEGGRIAACVGCGWRAAHEANQPSVKRDMGMQEGWALERGPRGGGERRRQGTSGVASRGSLGWRACLDGGQ